VSICSKIKNNTLSSPLTPNGLKSQFFRFLLFKGLKLVLQSGCWNAYGDMSQCKEYEKLYIGVPCIRLLLLPTLLILLLFLLLLHTIFCFLLPLPLPPNLFILLLLLLFIIGHFLWQIYNKKCSSVDRMSSWLSSCLFRHFLWRLNSDVLPKDITNTLD